MRMIIYTPQEKTFQAKCFVNLTVVDIFKENNFKQNYARSIGVDLDAQSGTQNCYPFGQDHRSKALARPDFLSFAGNCFLLCFCFVCFISQSDRKKIKVARAVNP